MQHEWEILREMRTIFWLENLKGGDHSEDPGTDVKIILERIFGKEGEKVCTRFIWLRIGNSGRFL